MSLIQYKDRNRLPDENAVAIFDHMTRTGGAALMGAVLNGHAPYSPSERYSGNYSAGLNFRKNYIPGKYKFYSGHGVSDFHHLIPTEDAFYFTLIRNPLKQYISTFLAAVNWHGVSSEWAK